MLKLPTWLARWTNTSSEHAEDSLDAFGTERSERHRSTPRSAPEGAGVASGKRFQLPIVVTGLLIVAAIGYGATGYIAKKWKPFDVEAASASLTIESDPSGAEVLSDGVRQGTTPLNLSVTPGEHTFELISGTRRMPLRTLARAGAAVVHHVQFDTASEVPTKASLSVVTDPAKLRILLDGKPLGVSPLLATDLEPGAHRVEVVGATGMRARTVDLYAGETASVILSAALPATPAGPSVGWLSVNAPVPLQIVQGTDLIGTSQTARIMLPAGKHDLQLTNETLGIAERRTVEVTAGSTATVRVAVPSGRLSINALPWAQTWVDGKPVGETPIGNYQVSVGTHEVLFRHPDLGERRQTIVVTLKEPARVSVDMRKPQ